MEQKQEKEVIIKDEVIEQEEVEEVEEVIKKIQK